MKIKAHRIVSVDAENALDKIENCFMIKTLNKQGIERNFFNLIQDIYEKLRVNIILNGERWGAFHLR